MKRIVKILAVLVAVYLVYKVLEWLVYIGISLTKMM